MTETEMRTLNVGDLVHGPSVVGLVRTWRILSIADSGTLAVGQNIRARKPFRQPIYLADCSVVSDPK